MIPQFPNFVKLNPNHKHNFQEFTKKFPPYSDHNFTSLFMWDVSGETMYSILNNNLAIKFKDYLSDKKFFSFIGNNFVEETIEQLIEFSNHNGHGDELLLLPKNNFTKEELRLLSEKYTLTEDRNNFDYILNIEELANFSGGKYLNKRNKLNNFLRRYNPQVVIKSIKDLDFQKELIKGFDNWIKNTTKTRDKTYVNYNEIRAFKKLIEHHQFFDIWAIAVFINGKIRGFSLFEIIDDKYAQNPFQKGDFNFKGIYEFLYNTLAKYLNEKGIKYLNIYQDLGHEGLRNAKLDYNPFFLKKYKISKKLTD